MAVGEVARPAVMVGRVIITKKQSGNRILISSPLAVGIRVFSSVFFFFFPSLNNNLSVKNGNYGQVTECSLRTHAVQLKRQPSNLTQ